MGSVKGEGKQSEKCTNSGEKREKVRTESGEILKGIPGERNLLKQEAGICEASTILK
jgi:hypothetical protein